MSRNFLARVAIIAGKQFEKDLSLVIKSYKSMERLPWVKEHIKSVDVKKRAREFFDKYYTNAMVFDPASVDIFQPIWEASEIHHGNLREEIAWLDEQYQMGKRYEGDEDPYNFVESSDYLDALREFTLTDDLFNITDSRTGLKYLGSIAFNFISIQKLVDGGGDVIDFPEIFIKRMTTLMAALLAVLEMSKAPPKIDDEEE